MDLTQPQRRALAALATLCEGDEDAPERTASARQVARILWPDSPAWNKVTFMRGGRSGAMGGTMPMKAATLLWRLHSHGLAYEHDRRWSITSSGRRFLAETSGAQQ